MALTGDSQGRINTPYGEYGCDTAARLITDQKQRVFGYAFRVFLNLIGRVNDCDLIHLIVDVLDISPL